MSMGRLTPQTISMGRVPSTMARQAWNSDEPCTSTRMRMPAPESTPSQACATRRSVSLNSSPTTTAIDAAASMTPTISAAADSRHAPLPPWVTTTSPTSGPSAVPLAAPPPAPRPSRSRAIAMMTSQSTSFGRDAGRDSGGAPPLDVAVPHRDRELVAEAPPELLRDGDRAVASPRAPDGDRRVGLALALEASHRQLDELLGLVDEGARLGVVEDEARDGLVLAREGRQRGHEERVRQEAHVEHHVGLDGDAVLEAEGQQR